MDGEIPGRPVPSPSSPQSRESLPGGLAPSPVVSGDPRNRRLGRGDKVLGHLFHGWWEGSMGGEWVGTPTPGRPLGVTGGETPTSTSLPENGPPPGRNRTGEEPLGISETSKTRRGPPRAYSRLSWIVGSLRRRSQGPRGGPGHEAEAPRDLGSIPVPTSPGSRRLPLLNFAP